MDTAPRPAPPSRKDRPVPASTATTTSRAALEALKAMLDSRDHTAELAWDGTVPYLAVANRHVQLREAVYADDRSYWWPWGQPIAAVGNPKAAADKIRYVLAATPGPAHE